MKLFLFFILISSNLFAKDYLLSRKEFLDRLDAGTLALDKAPIFTTTPDIIDRMIQAQKKEFPGFQDGMFYYAYVKSNAYTYFVFYEWYRRGCVWGYTEDKKYQNASSDETRGSMATAEQENYEKIDKKYCTQILGLEHIGDSGLTRIPGAIRYEAPKKGIKK